jgi:hypothetical protein
MPGSRRPSAGRWLLGRLCLPPGLVVVLDAPGDELFRRSGEHSAAALDVQRRGYLDLAARLRDVVVVDASGSTDRVRRDLTRAAWTRQVDVWHRSGLNRRASPALFTGRTAGPRRPYRQEMTST